MAAAKTDLPPSIPTRSDPVEGMLDWINDAAGRAHNPLVAARRFGFELDARLELIFANGDHVRVRQRELMGANGLRHVLQAYDGTKLPNYGQEGCADIVSRIIWASEASVRDDELEAFLDDVAAFLRRSLGHGLMRRDYRDDGHGVIADLTTINARRTGGRDTEPPAFVLDTSADALWVPRGALLTYLRDVRSKVDQNDVRGLLEEAGWQWVTFQRRQPNGTRKPKVRVWVVAAGWEDCPFDLQAAIDDAPEAKP